MVCLKFFIQSQVNRDFLMKFGRELKTFREKDLTNSFRIFIMVCVKTEKIATH